MISSSPTLDFTPPPQTPFWRRVHIRFNRNRERVSAYFKTSRFMRRRGLEVGSWPGLPAGVAAGVLGSELCGHRPVVLGLVSAVGLSAFDKSSKHVLLSGQIIHCCPPAATLA